MDNVRRQLGELASLADKTDAAERKILEAAEKRLAWAGDRMAELKPRAILDGEAGREYQELSLERQRLQTVIAQARKNLAE